MSDDHVSCLPRARARDTGAFPLPLAALLALRLPASVSRAGGALGSVVPPGSADRPGTESAGAKL